MGYVLQFGEIVHKTIKRVHYDSSSDHDIMQPLIKGHPHFSPRNDHPHVVPDKRPSSYEP